MKLTDYGLQLRSQRIQPRRFVISIADTKTPRRSCACPRIPTRRVWVARGRETREISFTKQLLAHL